MNRWVSILLLVVVFLSACRHPTHVAYLGGCSFCDDPTTEGAEFPDPKSQSNKTWSHRTCFEYDTFENTAIFKHNIFQDTAVFTDASFSDLADFMHDTFNKAVYFDNVSFAKSTHFDYARFSRYAKFTDLHSTDKVSLQFDGSTLPDTIDFSQNPALKCTIDLTTANFDDPDRFDSASGVYKRPHYVFLFNTDISKFKLDYFHFRLLVPDSTITPSLGPKHQRISNDQKEVMYEALLNNFKQNGQEESYRRLDIEYQTFKWKNSWRRWFVWFPTLWWNFGYNKEYVFLWIFGCLFVFSFINSRYVKRLNTEVYVVLRPKKIEDLSSFRKRWWYSLHYTANVFFRLTLDRECMRFDTPGLTIYFFFIYLLGTLCLGYLANFILQK